MNLVKTFGALMIVVLAQAAFAADPRPHYDMRTAWTYLWDQDVDYYSPAIVLHRTDKTNAIHYVEFNVASYEKYCQYWQNQCVQYDNRGNCVRWERVCARWDLISRQVPKRIELNFRKAPVLASGQEETYEIKIDRQKPFSEGEDRVYTWFREESVVQPVKIRRMGPYDYTIEIK